MSLRSGGGSSSRCNNRRNVITISPLSNSCTACATKFYEFSLTNTDASIEITKIFCEMLGIEINDLAQQMKLSKLTPPQLPFCPNCLLELNEIRQFNMQLRKIDDTLSRLKDSMIVSTINKINTYVDDSENTRLDPSQMNIRFVHEHIKTRYQCKPWSKNGLSQSASSSPAQSRTSVAQDDGDSSDIPADYPLFVGLDEDGPGNLGGALVKMEDVEEFDPLSGDKATDTFGADDSMESDEEVYSRQSTRLVFSGIVSNGSHSSLQNIDDGGDDDTNSNEIYEAESKSSRNEFTLASQRGIALGEYFELQENSSSNELPLQDASNYNKSEPVKRRRNLSAVAIASGFRNNQPVANLRNMSHGIKIDFQDPSTQVRDNFTMCPICFKYTLKEDVELEPHSCEQKSQTAHFQCGYCDIISQTERSLLSHMKHHYVAKKPKVQTLDSTHAKLLEVYAALSGPYPCPYCDSVFSRKADLIRGHISTEHGIRLKPFPCSICKSAFRSKNDLERHFRTHTGERPFHCYCGKTFTRNHHLKTHQTTCQHQRRPFHGLSN